jgi:hypothetical protein
MFDIHKESDVGTFLCMARFCYEKLGFYQEGQNLSRMALSSEAAKARPWLAARCNVYIAVGYSLLIRNVESRIERRKMSMEAEKHLKAAEDLDPFDYLVKYYLALHYAMARQVNQLLTFFPFICSTLGPLSKWPPDWIIEFYCYPS